MKDVISEIKPKIVDFLKEMQYKIDGPIKCLNPSHNDKHPSMSLYRPYNVVHCFSCGVTYDIFSLYALIHNYDIKRDFKQIVQELCEKYGISYEPKQISNTSYQETTYDYSEDNFPAIEYLMKRGISYDVIKKYNISLKDHKYVSFRIDEETEVLRSINDNVTNKHLKNKGEKNKIFNYQKIKQNDKTPLFITESIIDALSLETVMPKAICLSLNGAANSNQLLELLEEKEYEGILFLCLDADITGILASVDITNKLSKHKIQTYIVNKNAKSYKEHKDINELLVNNQEYLELLIKNLRIEYNKIIKQTNVNNNTKYMEQYSSKQTAENLINKIRKKEISPCIPTGFITLDSALSGGLSVGTLNVIGGMSGLGKTTFTMQIADNVAKQDRDVLVFSLEMSKEELILKTFSRISCEIKTGISNNVFGYSTKEIMYNSFEDDDPNLMEKILERYEKFSNNIYIFEFGEELITADFIVKKVEEHIQLTGRQSPLVVIDYLQIIPHESTYGNDRSQMDNNILKFKKLARENSLPVLLISALNRASYNQEITMGSFRDSSCIEYTSDVLIALCNTLSKEQTEQLKANGYYLNEEVLNARNERNMTLKILKQRSGCIGDLKNFKFYAKYNTFLEILE